MTICGLDPLNLCRSGLKIENRFQKKLVLGQLGWKAFTAQTPELMFEMAQQDTSVLPFLQSGLLRLFEEFPAEGCGLTRTEHCILIKLEVESPS